MMPVYSFRSLNVERLNELYRRNSFEDPSILEPCQEIFQQVRKGGDAALRELTQRFDNVTVDSFEASDSAFADALASLPAQTLSAMHRAAKNIARFHGSQRHYEDPVRVEPDVICWRESRPIERVGLYVPGGTAVLPSTALMLGVPAKIAGCREMILCSPPQSNGKISKEVLAAAEIAGVKKVYSLGGVQAIAAMTFGTESVPRVDKIFGPGNRYVQTAKFLAMQHGVALDALAGPSEVLVIADDSATPSVVASDLISQAEHDRESRAVLVSTSSKLIEQVQDHLEDQLSDLPRAVLARQALSDSFCLLVESVEEAFRFSNRYAPEHLILQIRDARSWVSRVEAAGSVFVGPWSPEVAGDYASGTNHVLPTSGTARATSGVSLDSFINQITFQELGPKGLLELGPTLEVLARTEELEGHARAVELRVKELQSRGDSPDQELQSADSSDFDLETLIRPNILKLKPYRSARDTIQSGLLLDANESPFSQKAGSIDLNRYPDPRQRKLRSALAAYLGVDSGQVLCAVGSDEVLDWILKVFCQPGKDSVAITPPTYGMYQVVADILGVEAWEFPLNDEFDFDAASFLRTVPLRVKVLILCSPNNPTANLLSEGEILAVCRNWDGIVVLDEAYIEFSERPSMARRLKDLPNLIVLRTFSKAAGRAGIRLGCAVASPEIISYFSKVKTPYNLNTWTMEEGCRVLEQTDSQQQQIEIIKNQRRRITDSLEASSPVDKVFPSEANFVLFRCRNATDIYTALLEKQIVIRDRSSVPGLENCLRVSVGTPSENQRFLHEFNSVVEAMNDE